MKKRQGGGIILLRKGRLGQNVGGGAGKFALAVVVEDLLETLSRGARPIQRAMTFTKKEIDAGAATCDGISVQIFFVLRNGEIVEFAQEKRVRIIELATIW